MDGGWIDLELVKQHRPALPFVPAARRLAVATRRKRLGLKLDLDQGTLTAYKNRTLVGVITTNLGVGPFCWYVDLRHAGQGMSIGWVPKPLAAARDEMPGKKQKL